MPLLPKNRAVLPACLTLGALLWGLPALADPPATSPIAQTHWQKLPLQHVEPSHILKALPWNQGTSFPAGVTRVYGLAGDNSLFVEATSDGFARLRDMVKRLDVDPGQVQVRMTLARATPADMDASGVKFNAFPSPNVPTAHMGDATGPEVARFAQTLKAQGGVLQAPVITTTNSVEASISISSGQPIPALPALASVTFGVTPRVNGDGSVSLVLHPKATWRVAGKTNADGTPATETQDFETLCTVGNGQTWVVANLFPGAVGADGSQLLLFVTPSVVSANEPAPASVTIQRN